MALAIKVLIRLLIIQLIIIAALSLIVTQQYKRNFMRYYYYKRAKVVSNWVKSNPNISQLNGVWSDSMIKQLNSDDIKNVSHDIENEMFPFALNNKVFKDNVQISENTVLFFNYDEGWNQSSSKQGFVQFINDNNIGFVVLKNGEMICVTESESVNQLNWGAIE